MALINVVEAEASEKEKSKKPVFNRRDCVHTIVGCDRPSSCEEQQDCFWRRFHLRVKEIDDRRAATEEI